MILHNDMYITQSARCIFAKHCGESLPLQGKLTGKVPCKKAIFSFVVYAQLMIRKGRGEQGTVCMWILFPTEWQESGQWSTESEQSKVVDKYERSEMLLLSSLLLLLLLLLLATGWSYSVSETERPFDFFILRSHVQRNNRNKLRKKLCTEKSQGDGEFTCNKSSFVIMTVWSGSYLESTLVPHSGPQ